MGDREKNPQIPWSYILAFRELDDALDLTPIASAPAVFNPGPSAPVHLQPLGRRLDPAMRFHGSTITGLRWLTLHTGE